MPEELFDFSEIEALLRTGQASADFSFGEAAEQLMRGDFQGIFQELGRLAGEYFWTGLQASAAGVGKVLVVCLLMTLFTYLSGAFRETSISRTGFYVGYMLMTGLLLNVFLVLYQLAEETMEQVLAFCQVLFPAVMLAVTYAGANLLAAGSYEFALFVMTAAEWVYVRLLLPLSEYYLVLGLLGALLPQNSIASLVGLLRSLMKNVMKYSLLAVTGVQVIQGMILPQADVVKNLALYRTVSMLPGVGNASDVLLSLAAGSAGLIKNAVGAAGVFALLFLCLGPVLQIAAASLLYRLLAAFLQPLGDARIHACLGHVSACAGVLLQMILTVCAIFAAIIAVTCCLARGI